MPVSAYSKWLIEQDLAKSKREQWPGLFLDAILMGANVRRASKIAGISENTAYKRRKVDAEFDQAWREAARISTELLEEEAERRAYHGVVKPILYKGEVVAKVREYSDTLMMFLLKARKPEMYREAPKVVVNNRTNTTSTTVNLFEDIRRAAAILQGVGVGTEQPTTPSDAIVTVHPTADSDVPVHGTGEPVDGPQADGAPSQPAPDRVSDGVRHP
jgi:hypothetical protein